MQVSVTNEGAMELAATGSVSPIFQVMSNELSTPKILFCPSDRQRQAAVNFLTLAETNLSYFVGIDATTNAPASTLLCGDRNLTNTPARVSRFIPVDKTTRLGWNAAIHSAYGNLLFGDGHAEGYANPNRQPTSVMADGITNRLAMPW